MRAHDVNDVNVQCANITSSIKLCLAKPCVQDFTVNAFYYSVFTFSWPRFESGSLHNGGMLILRMYFAVDGMPIEIYGERWIAGLLTSGDVMLYMAGFETTRGI